MAGTQWGSKKHMNMKHLEASLDDASIASFGRGLQTLLCINLDDPRKASLLSISSFF